MQTFLPFENFEACARCLDNRRLSKQIVECQQILSHKGWDNHPAVKMWQGYDGLLKQYAYAMFQQFYYRFGNDHQSWTWISALDLAPTVYKPWWLGDERLHRSHRSRLWQKFPSYYKQFEADGRLDLPYFWPTKESL